MERLKNQVTALKVTWADSEADLARVRAALEKCERALRTLDREPDWLTLADEARAALEGR